MPTGVSSKPARVRTLEGFDDRLPLAMDRIGNHVVGAGVRDPRKEPHKSFKYVDIAGIDNHTGRITVAKELLGRDAPSRARRVIRTNDVIVSTVRPNLNATALVPSRLDNQICSTGFCVLRCKSSLDPRYLYEFTRTTQFVGTLSAQMKGASYPAVTNDNVLDVKIPLPPLEIQRKISSMLIRVDNMRELRERAKELAGELIQSAFLEMFGDPITNPKKWEIVTIGDIVSDTQYGMSKPLTDNPEHYPIIRMNNINPDGSLDLSAIRYVDLDKSEIEKYRIQTGDVLFNRTNSRELVGKTGLVTTETDLVFASYLIRVSTIRELANPGYLWAFLNSRFGREILVRRARGAIGQANINSKELKSIRIPLPPLDLQAKFSSVIWESRALRDRLTRSSLEIDGLFHSVMQKVFRGDLRTAN